MPPAPELVVLVDDPKSCYIPGDKVTGQVVLTSQTFADASEIEIGIEFHGFEFVRYNKTRRENSLFSFTRTPLMVPYTPHADKYSYPFEFQFPQTTRPREMPQAMFELAPRHTLPPSMSFNRPGVAYSFDILIKYELFAWLKTPGKLGLALEKREELTFWSIDPDSDAWRPAYQDCQHVEMVPCESPSLHKNGKGKEKEKMAVEEHEDEQQQQQKHPGLFSRLFSSKHTSSSSSLSLSLPCERVDVHMQIPTSFNRMAHNPIHFYVYSPSKREIPPVKLRTLVIELKAIVRVPCMETPAYGSRQGEGEESIPLKSISEENGPFEIPQEGSGTLQINIFDDPIRQLARCLPDFKTFNVARSHLLTVRGCFQCGDKTFDFEHIDLQGKMPPASGRPPAELPPPAVDATGYTGTQEKPSTAEKGEDKTAGIFYPGKGDAGPSREDEEPPPPYEP